MCQSNDKLFSIDESENNDRSLKVNLNSKLSGVKFRWLFRFNRLESSLLREHVILPLIFSCAEYQLRELELIRLIQAKDKELDDYKSQGVKLSRSNIKKHHIFNLVIVLINVLFNKSILIRRYLTSTHLTRILKKR